MSCAHHRTGWSAVRHSAPGWRRPAAWSAALTVLVAASCSDETSSGTSTGGAAGSGAQAASGAGGSQHGGGGSGAAAPGGSSAGGSVIGGTTAIGGNAQGGGGAVGGSGGAGQGGAGCTGPEGTGTGPCEFPQGVPDEGFIAAACSYQDTDPAVDAAVNTVMVSLTGCGVSSDCSLAGYSGANAGEKCQSWFAAVTAALRADGYCAGQHVVGATDEIAVSSTGCDGKWYGYHICNYGGPQVVWAAGARRGWWAIDPSCCP